MSCRCRNCLTPFAVVLLIGCGGSALDDVTSVQAEIRPVVNQSGAKGPSALRVARFLSSAEEEEIDAPQRTTSVDAVAEERPPAKKYWAFPDDDSSGPLLNLPPPVGSSPAAAPSTRQSPCLEAPVVREGAADDIPLASLLPPRSVEVVRSQRDALALEPKPTATFETHEMDLNPLEANEQGSSDCFIDVDQDGSPQAPDPADSEQVLVDAVLRDCPPAATGVLTDQRIDELAKSKTRRAYALANRAAHYAARQELIEVLRMISRAKDAQQGAPERTIALAAGLRALKEANDFAPRGTQLEADLVIDVICASHRTPVAKQVESSNVMPQQMLDRYFRYAQLKLGTAMAGEQAGSMALHALGKLTSQLGKMEPDKHRLTQRRAIAFQQAALLAHNQNHLAAHELAVLLADSGHYAEAEKLLRQVAAREPNTTVLRNLATVQEKLGHVQRAAASRNFAQQLLRNGATGTNNVQWVSPQAFASTRGNAPRYSTAMTKAPTNYPVVPTQHGQTPWPNWR